jgi:hypothetical protein
VLRPDSGLIADEVLEDEPELADELRVEAIELG